MHSVIFGNWLLTNIETISIHFFQFLLKKAVDDLFVYTGVNNVVIHRAYRISKNDFIFFSCEIYSLPLSIYSILFPLLIKRFVSHNYFCKSRTRSDNTSWLHNLNNTIVRDNNLPFTRTRGTSSRDIAFLFHFSNFSLQRAFLYHQFYCHLVDENRIISSNQIYYTFLNISYFD